MRLPAPPLALVTLALLSCAPLSARAPGPGIAPLPNPLAKGENGVLTGHRLMQAGEFSLALRAYMRAATEDGVNADVLAGIGSASLRLRRIGQAEAFLRRALELDPTFVPALNNLGVVLMEQGRMGEARRTFQEAYALDSGATDAIRDNLRRAIALSQPALPASDTVPPAFILFRMGPGHYALLPQT